MPTGSPHPCAVMFASWLCRPCDVTSFRKQVAVTDKMAAATDAYKWADVSAYFLFYKSTQTTRWASYIHLNPGLTSGNHLFAKKLVFSQKVRSFNSVGQWLVTRKKNTSKSDNVSLNKPDALMKHFSSKHVHLTGESKNSLGVKMV